MHFVSLYLTFLASTLSTTYAVSASEIALSPGSLSARNPPFARQVLDDDDTPGANGQDANDGTRTPAMLNTAIPLPVGKKIDVTYPDGFEMDVNVTTPNTVTVTSGAPSITTVPAGFKQLVTNSWKVTFGSPLAANTDVKVEVLVTAAAVTAAGGSSPKDARLAFLQNGAWMVDEGNFNFDANESKTQYTGVGAKSNNEWTPSNGCGGVKLKRKASGGLDGNEATRVAGTLGRLDETLKQPRAPPHELFQDGNAKGIKIAGWSISTRKAPIFNSLELAKAAERITIPFPEMFFGHNALIIRHEASGFELKFDPTDALALVDASPEAGSTIRVAYSEHWSKKSAVEHAKIRNVIRPYDWTYSTLYAGTISPVSSTSSTTASTTIPTFRLATPTDPCIDTDLLRRPDPILFYDDVILYEDELADNGSCVLSARVRVMPTCFLVLARLCLRVDDVVFRVWDTRVYHAFGIGASASKGGAPLIRESRGWERPYAELKARIPKQPPWNPSRSSAEDLSLLTDPNWVSQQLAMMEDEETKGRAAEAPSSTSKPLMTRTECLYISA
ncbi:hypothetical protein HK101_007516 [Irineochytrium annulatum]|nr:hypothetical protein HK101_007516 [Irineochytrium annulatum]